MELGKAGINDVHFGKGVKVIEPVNLYGCHIGDNTFIGPFVEIQTNVTIGKRCKIQSHSFICELVEIGDNCFISHGVMFINDLFENGGPSCISCHNVKYDDLTSGGLLARDLTHVYDRMGDAGIKGILSSPPFPAMAASYKNNKLTEKEVMQLTAFFNDAHEANAGHEMVDADKNNGLILLGGGVAFLIILIIILIVFNKRKKDCVKQGIYDRQIKSDCSK